MDNEIKSSPSFLSRLGRVLWIFLRVIFFLAIVAIIGGAIYAGVPYLNEKIVFPIQKNTARLDELAQLDTQVAEMQERINDLENSQTENAQTLEEMQGTVEALESTIEAHDKTLEALDEIEASLDTLLKTSKEHEKLLVISATAIKDVQRQVDLSRSVELLSRAQLYLSQNNFGLAKTDIESARDLLLNSQTEMSNEKSKTLALVIEKLNFALDNLPEYPIIIVDSVNIAWELLVNDLPETAESTPTENSD